MSQESQQGPAADKQNPWYEYNIENSETKPLSRRIRGITLKRVMDSVAKPVLTLPHRCTSMWLNQRQGQI